MIVANEKEGGTPVLEELNRSEERILQIKDRMLFPLPPTDENVYPQQCCPAFVPREGALPWERECWFCEYADFHLEKARPLEVGICGYPVKRKCLRKRVQV